MLPQKNRVKTSEFDLILKEGKRIFGDNISLSYVKIRLISRLLWLFQKKISKKAVDRNRQKRLAREAIKNVFKDGDSNRLFGNFQYSCLFFIKKKILDLPLSKVIEEVNLLSKRMK